MIDPEVILTEVRDLAPVTAREIADSVNVSESAVRSVLRRLEKSGLVESDNYQRRARVWLPKEEQ